MTGAVVVFGSINLDFVFEMDALPAPGQTRLARRFSAEPGGKGANQAVAARRAGAAVHMVGAVGEDGFAARALAGLEAAGIDLGPVRRVPRAPTGCASVATDAAGRNQIAVAAGANAALEAADLPAGLLRPGSVLLAQMEAEPAAVAGALARARAAGMLTMLNLAPPRPLERDALRSLSVLLLNEDEAAELAAALGCAGDAAALHASLGPLVVRTLGAAGVEAAGPEGGLRVPAPAVDAIDTTAAGDCFAGWLAAALLAGMPLEAALRRACAAAALACTVRGSQGSLPAAEAVDAFLGRG